LTEGTRGKGFRSGLNFQANLLVHRREHVLLNRVTVTTSHVVHEEKHIHEEAKLMGQKVEG
jgi:hypothetical protein